MLKDETEEKSIKKKIQKYNQSQLGLTCQTRDLGHKTKITQ
jgi:hypothetical protein